MHIAQFTVGQFVRHSSYVPGQYAVVEKVDAVIENGDARGRVTVKPVHSDSEVIEDGSEQWDDGEWAEVGQQWFHSHQLDVPEEVAAAYSDDDD